MTPVQTFVALVTKPRQAFTELEKNPRFAAPMIVLLAANIALLLWFYATVDVDSLINHILASRGINAAQRAQIGGLMTRNTLMVSALFTGIVSIVVTQVVEAFYFYFVYTFFEVQRTFRQWFAFTWWCSLPQLITIVAAVVMIVSGRSPASAGVLSPFSLNELFFHFDLADSGYSLLNSISLVQLLTMLLMVIGAHTWSKRSWASSVVVVILPRLLFYGVWAWFAFRS
ncbi:MAG TPA: YIP1 family protein [Steroidobacteraceae bacterium]|jgi:hypothetical protein|nr:YIP1 family protein [Steroidobacteraceae bacterium]